MNKAKKKLFTTLLPSTNSNSTRLMMEQNDRDISSTPSTGL